jgi:hypothetical protein
MRCAAGPTRSLADRTRPRPMSSESLGGLRDRTLLDFALGVVDASPGLRLRREVCLASRHARTSACIPSLVRLGVAFASSIVTRSIAGAGLGSGSPRGEPASRSIQEDLATRLELTFLNMCSSCSY